MRADMSTVTASTQPASSTATKTITPTPTTSDRTATTRSRSTSADTTAAEATKSYVQNLFEEFRELVLGLQEEQRELKTKLRDFPLASDSQPSLLLPSSAARRCRQTFATGVSANGTDIVYNTNRPLSATTTATATPTASPINDPSVITNANTSSSGSASQTTGISSNTKPPSYKTATHSATLPAASQVPKAPIRIKKQQRFNNNNNYIHSINPTNMSVQATTQAVARGALIVLEGLDRVGKSTLAKRLVEHLERIKKPVSFCRFPDRSTPIGILIDEFLQNKSATKRSPIDEHALHLLFSANRWELSKRIKNTLIQGTTVIVDRYSYSGIAYSSAKQGLSMKWCCEPEKGLPKPDLVIYLELPKEVQYKRPGFGDELFETSELQERVRFQYEQLMDASQDTWLRINVDKKSPDQVLSEIIVPVKHCLESSAYKRIGELDFL